MKVGDYEVTYPRLLLAGLVVLLGSAAVVGLTTSSTAFGAYNSAWDGTQDLREVTATNDTEIVVAESTSAYEEVDPNTTTAAIIAPDTNYSARQVEAISLFLNRGGRLVVAGDVDAASNNLLADLGVETRIQDAPVRDDEENYRSPAFPVATNVTEAPITSGVSQVTLNYPALLTPGENADVVVATSEFAYVDENRDGTLNENELIGSRPIVATESYGTGRVVVISDPSIFINTMLAQPDNAEFAQNVVGGRETAVFDYSHTAELPLAVSIVQAIAGSSWLQLAVALVVVTSMLLAWRSESGLQDMRSVFGLGGGEPATPEVSEEAIIAGLEERHPEWERERVERVARSITAHRRKEYTND